VIINRLSADRQWFTGLKKLLPKVFCFLKLLSKGDSKREKLVSEEEQQQSHSLSSLTTTFTVALAYLWHNIHVLVFKCDFLMWILFYFIDKRSK
jgi:hypothetical protein